MESLYCIQDGNEMSADKLNFEFGIPHSGSENNKTEKSEIIRGTCILNQNFWFFPKIFTACLKKNEVLYFWDANSEIIKDYIELQFVKTIKLASDSILKITTNNKEYTIKFFEMNALNWFDRIFRAKKRMKAKIDSE